uniref:Des-Arg9-[Val1,Thr6]-bradykinin n=1 Tax=Pithecopus hypochondrialis TaxID=317381 RepID=BRK2_PITHY|nr:RecName: Full=Des-Arg9-[Val1,Thr6]-bradykinin; Short=Des-Arg-[Val1,Thr6]-bradykinin [Pithecopus hypochondrialis]
VPPGFTPF